MKGLASHLCSAGFTLVEVIIAVTLASVIGVFLVSLMVGHNDIFFLQQTRLNQGINLNEITDLISADIKNAAFITPAYPAAPPLYQSSTSTLILALPSQDANGNIIANTYDYETITASTQNNKILIKKLYPDSTSSRHATTQVLTSNLSKLQLAYLDKNNQSVSPASASKVGLIINVNDIYNTSNQTSSASAQVSLRNN